MEDVSKKWICPKLMGEGEVTQKFGGGVKKKETRRDEVPEMGEEIMKKGYLKDYVQQTRTYEMAVK